MLQDMYICLSTAVNERGREKDEIEAESRSRCKAGWLLLGVTLLHRVLRC